ncbi:MAG: Mg/Co/Ni transporter MgtE [Paraglaciecola sp.]|jgi:Mg/Co/Ni transporter MgtE
MNPNNKISDIMTTDLKAVRPDTSMATIKKTFEKYEFHHLTVVTDGNQLVGIISREGYFKLFKTLS